MFITNEDPNAIKPGEEELDENSNPIVADPNADPADPAEPADGEETVTVPKKTFSAIQRKAIAYDADKKRKPAPTLPADQATPADELVQDVKTLKDAENKRQFGFANSLSPEETDKVFQLAGGKPTAETLKDPFIVAGLEAMRAKKRLESNTPGASHGAKLFGGKKFSELDPAQKQKEWDKQMGRG